MTRKVFNKEFKLEAVKLFTERGMTCEQAARRRWHLMPLLSNPIAMRRLKRSLMREKP